MLQFLDQNNFLKKLKISSRLKKSWKKADVEMDKICHNRCPKKSHFVRTLITIEKRLKLNKPEQQGSLAAPVFMPLEY